MVSSGLLGGLLEETLIFPSLEDRSSARRLEEHYRFAEFEIDLGLHELRRRGSPIHAEPQVFDLTVHLVRNHDRVVSKDELIDNIWNGRIISEAAFSSRINGARRVLGDSGTEQQFIKTLHRRFVGDVEEGSDADTVKLVPGDAGGSECCPPSTSVHA